MKVFEESLYKETEKLDALEEESTEVKKKLHECEEKYADVSFFLCFHAISPIIALTIITFAIITFTMIKFFKVESSGKFI